jgi:hypothetical protein
MEWREWCFSELLREVGLSVIGRLPKRSFSWPVKGSAAGGEDERVEFPESVVLLKARLIGLLGETR